MMRKIRKRRRELELSQYDIEKLCGIPQTKLSLVERGYRKLNHRELRKLCKILQMEEKKLFPDD